MIETLSHRALDATGGRPPMQLLVFSKAGFADSARREADRLGNVRLVGLDEMLR